MGDFGPEGPKTLVGGRVFHLCGRPPPCPAISGHKDVNLCALFSCLIETSLNLLDQSFSNLVHHNAATHNAAMHNASFSQRYPYPFFYSVIAAMPFPVFSIARRNFLHRTHRPSAFASIFPFATMVYCTKQQEICQESQRSDVATGNARWPTQRTTHNAAMRCTKFSNSPICAPESPDMLEGYGFNQCHFCFKNTLVCTKPWAFFSHRPPRLAPV